MSNLLAKFESAKPFTDAEAWSLFRLAAIGEACGWTMLIAGITLKQYVLHGNNVPVLIAGQIHGTLFIIYIVAALALYPSLGWSRGKAILAGLASIPPYGSIIFEQWAAHRRSRTAIITYNRCLAYVSLCMATES
jgi:integral membrane protein